MGCCCRTVSLNLESDTLTWQYKCMNRHDDFQCPKDHYQAQGDGKCGPDWPTAYPNPPKPTCCKCHDPDPTTPPPTWQQQIAGDNSTQQLQDEYMNQTGEEIKKKEA